MVVNINYASNRGLTDLGWLKIMHSFSFAQYFNPIREKFGLIRALNQEIYGPDSSLEMHEYHDLEIMILVLKEKILLKTNNNNSYTLTSGDIALISTGKGLAYSLINESKILKTELLQIWFFPRNKNLEPGIHLLNHNSEKIQVISKPCQKERVINNEVWIHRFRFEKMSTFNYQPENTQNLLLFFVIKGELIITNENNELRASEHDTVEIINPNNHILLNFQEECEILIIETIPD